MSIVIGIVIAAFIYIPVIRQKFTKPILRQEQVFPEVFIPIAIVGGILLTSGLFILVGQQIEPLIAGPLFGAATTASGAFLIFQTLFNFMGASFKPHYIASVFASNDLFRSVIASVFHYLVLLCLTIWPPLNIQLLGVVPCWVSSPLL